MNSTDRRKCVVVRIIIDGVERMKSDVRAWEEALEIIQNMTPYTSTTLRKIAVASSKYYQVKAHVQESINFKILLGLRFDNPEAEIEFYEALRIIITVMFNNDSDEIMASVVNTMKER